MHVCNQRVTLQGATGNGLERVASNFRNPFAIGCFPLASMQVEITCEVVNPLVDAGAGAQARF